MASLSISKIMQMSKHTILKKYRMDITRLLHNFSILLKPVIDGKKWLMLRLSFLTMHLWISGTSMEKQSYFQARRIV
jgi:hypothetical protein